MTDKELEQFFEDNYEKIYEKYCELYPEQIHSDFILEEDGDWDSIDDIMRYMMANKEDKPSSFDVPEYVLAALMYIDNELSRIMWNINHKEFESPLTNSANSYKNEVFEMEAYSWDDEYDQPYNFKWKDYEISWYKHFRRIPKSNRQISPDECAIMLDECLKSIRKLEREDDEISFS